ALCMGPSGFIALLAGWFTTEVGRQPWVVYGVLRTKDALSPVSAEQVGLTLIIFVIVYCVVFGIGIYYMLKLMVKGPQFIHSQAHSDGEVIRASNRPMSTIDESLEVQPQEKNHD
ncbi:MAG: cytochrome ubiquinol oxidase subunit I, partial [Acinetobacter sp.]